MNITNTDIQCYGCGACSNACPFDAIIMEENENGFLHPIVDLERCQDCGKCLEVCPRLVNHYENSIQPECYAAWATDEIRLECSSGGIYTALAKEMLQSGGWVSGAVWDDDFRVKHIITDSEEDLALIRSSKYIQSDINKVYSEIREKLELGQRVLFCGCPCQVAGLYSFLKKEYATLYTIDLICHGVPSHKVLKKYIQDEYSDKMIEKINFRDKSVFGWSTEMNIYLLNKEPIRKRAGKDAFYRAFLNNLCLNKSCETCQFSRLPRQGNISLGDFWNIERYSKDLNDGKGTSLVLINNEKGKMLFDENEFIMRKERIPLEFIHETCNSTVFEPFKHHYGSDRFFKEFSRINFSKSVNECLTFHYDIGLVTTWFARNFGAIFTAYALYKKLEEMGYSVLMLNKPKELWDANYFASDRNPIAIDFGHRNYNVSKEYSVSGIPNLELLNNSCDIFMLGSDQLWNPKVYAYLYYYFLDFADAKRRKISYATSIGADHFEGTDEDRYRISYLLKRFDNVSVRENQAARICEETFNVHPTKVLDPVFILDKSYYDVLADGINKNLNEDYIFAYILDGNMEKKRLIEEISKRYNLPVFCAYNLEAPEPSKSYLQFDEAEITTPEDWLWYLKHSRFVVTDSYHGACFSIIFHKNFVCMANSLRGTERFIELFEILKLQEHLLLDIHNVDMDKLFMQIDRFNYDRVERILEKERTRSINWLQNSLKSPYVKEMQTEDFVLEKTSRQFTVIKDEIKQLSSHINMLHMYTNIKQLELNAGCSVQEIVNILPSNSYFQQVQGKLGEPIIDTPVPYGVLTIKKTTDYFVEVQFSQITYASRKPQIYIAKYVDSKIVGWERLVSISEVNEMNIEIEKRYCEQAEKICELEKDIKFLIRKYAHNLED